LSAVYDCIVLNLPIVFKASIVYSLSYAE